ncbi:hypothetical protein CAC42_4002 [Sphaceloma murrayae]|uniref:AB hydrolase-1 domain-containing protein n=1 Tax=Sphaceloma murrayae TaxID=2082308 RepID=A0A2K1QT32_9PEZI|nr:hypothetical protein CAC42_4002 [Sphaceloma murrayae]
MPRVPFIGRLHFHEYLALFGSFILVGFESLARIVTLALPDPIIRFLYQQSRRLFNLLSTPQGRRSRNKKRAVSSPISKASDFTDLVSLYGYYAEEHIIHTTDGYLLGVHRLGYRRGEEDQKVNCGEGSIQKKIVYLHHGLLMNSEVWVCLTEEERCLPFVLVEQGYDVWLGNNRGNKYSKKSTKYSPTSTEFWNFSIDQFAFHDIPDSINYILETTKQKSLSYIGFSQGTAQAFATLSIHPKLNEKVDVFIALAPAMAPPGLASGIVSSFVKTSPDILFLLFGRKAILSSTTMWESILYPALFCWFIDKSLDFLFGWKSKNMTAHQKLAAYPHLFSYTSTKSVVHWFQIIRNGTFQMYDDEVQRPLSSTSKYYKVAKFPTRNIKTPIVLVYGGSDSLVDIKIMLGELPKHTEAVEVPHYEHLDFLWASDVHKQVFPHVMSALDFYASPTGKAAEANLFRKTVTSPPLPTYSETERSVPRLPQLQTSLDSEGDADSDSDMAERRRVFRAGHSPHPSVAALKAPGILESTSPATSSASLTPSKPEGYWSSDDPAPPTEDSPLRNKSSTGSNFHLSPEGDKHTQNVARRKSSKMSFESSRSSASGASGPRVGFGFGVGKAAPVEAAVDKTSGSGEKAGAASEEKKRGRKK